MRSHARVLGLACALGLWACATPSPVAPLAPVSAEPRPAVDPRVELLARAEALFKERSTPERLEEAIGLWLKALEREDEVGVRLALARAEHFAARLLSAPGRFARGEAHARKALQLLGVADGCTTESSAAAPALFWLAENLDGSARAAGLVAGAAGRREALCLAQRAAALEPGYFHAGPLRTLGRLLAQLPALDGGDVAASRKAFAEAQRLSPSFLQNRVDEASTLTVKVQDAAAFEARLAEVLAAPPGTAETAPEDRLAREAALALKTSGRRLFR